MLGWVVTRDVVLPSFGIGSTYIDLLGTFGTDSIEKGELAVQANGLKAFFVTIATIRTITNNCPSTFHAKLHAYTNCVH